MSAINQSILSWILLTPLIGALVVAILPDRGKLAAWLALATTLVTFGLTLHLPAHFIAGQPGFQFEINRKWIELGAAGQGIFYHVGVDGLSLWLVVLSGLLGPVGVLASWNAIKERKKVFYSLFLVQQTAMIGVFLVARPDALLRLLGADAGADGGVDRHVRAQGWAQGGDQVFPVHVYSIGAAAGGNPVALREDGNVRFHATPEPGRRRRVPCRSAVLGSARLPGGIRGQSAGVSAAWMAGGQLQ